MILQAISQVRCKTDIVCPVIAIKDIDASLFPKIRDPNRTSIGPTTPKQTKCSSRTWVPIHFVSTPKQAITLYEHGTLRGNEDVRRKDCIPFPMTRRLRLVSLKLA